MTETYLSRERSGKYRRLSWGATISVLAVMVGMIATSITNTASASAPYVGAFCTASANNVHWSVGGQTLLAKTTLTCPTTRTIGAISITLLKCASSAPSTCALVVRKCPLYVNSVAVAGVQNTYYCPDTGQPTLRGTGYYRQGTVYYTGPSVGNPLYPARAFYSAVQYVGSNPPANFS